MGFAGRIGGGDEEDVLALAERDGEVQAEDRLGLVALVEPGDLDGVQGDEDLGDALPAGDLADDLEPVRGQSRLVGRLVQGHLKRPARAPVARLQSDHLEVQRGESQTLRPSGADELRARTRFGTRGHREACRCPVTTPEILKAPKVPAGTRSSSYLSTVSVVCGCE